MVEFLIMKEIIIIPVMIIITFLPETDLHNMESLCNSTVI